MDSDSNQLELVLKADFDGRGREHEKNLILAYFQKPEARKLHLGAGTNRLAGWLNSDLRPTSSDMIFLDVTQPLPFRDSVFDYVFSEHLIEHVSYKEGLRFLRECFRVLKPGGKVRIATPDLAFVIDLYHEEKTTLQREYIRWSRETFHYLDGDSDTFIINNIFRDWGHQFIYDEKTLRRVLERTGFAEVKVCRTCESGEAELEGLENTGRMPEGLLELETLVLEARKPETWDETDTVQDMNIEEYVRHLERECEARGNYIETLGEYARKLEDELGLEPERRAVDPEGAG